MKHRNRIFVSSLTLGEVLAIINSRQQLMQTTKPSGTDSNPDLPAFDNIGAQFLQHFKLVVATTPKLREEVYRIRYRVYCQELKYESEENYPNSMEQDIYDQRSIHCLLMHQRSGLYAGSVRLILTEPHPFSPNLPIERVCRLSLKPYNLPNSAIGEVSRLAVVSQFRKRQEEVYVGSSASTTPQPRFTDEDRRYFPLIAIGLYLSATSVALEVGLDNVFTLMEPRLARHLRRFGINFAQLGELIEFHGQRGLFQISRSAVLSSMNGSTQDLFRMLRSEVSRSLSHSHPHLVNHRAA